MTSSPCEGSGPVVDAYQRDQQIGKGADARSTAVHLVKNGATISVVMKGLQRFDDEDLGLMNDMR